MVTGCLQGTLLVMGISFEISSRKKQRQELEGRIDDAVSRGEEERERQRAGQTDETTPLIRDEDR